MRRILSLLIVAFVTVTLTVLFSGPASALGGETFGCNVQPNTPSHSGFPGVCTTGRAAGGYVVTFEVFNITAGESFSWSGPSLVQGTLSNCNTSVCRVSLSASTDVDVTVSVIISQAGARETLSARVIIPAVCGRIFC
ncbi:MAG TPA: hypothetical protein VGL06_21355 [Pseudonocardiaceae bacterium]|jgi:hypothetical protein